MTEMTLNMDAFSHSQIASKVWLCEELDRLVPIWEKERCEVITTIAHREMSNFDGSVSGTIRLTNLIHDQRPTNNIILVLGGWYGVLSLLLLTRNRTYDIHTIRSLDIDPACAPIANALLNGYEIDEWRFRAMTHDCTGPIRAEQIALDQGPSIFINTSVEHFPGPDWYLTVPIGALVALQASDMAHDDHDFLMTGLDQFGAEFPMTKTLFEGRKTFDYPDKTFTRYMRIGIR